MSVLCTEDSHAHLSKTCQMLLACLRLRANMRLSHWHTQTPTHAYSLAHKQQYHDVRDCWALVFHSVLRFSSGSLVATRTSRRSRHRCRRTAAKIQRQSVSDWARAQTSQTVLVKVCVAHAIGITFTCCVCVLPPPAHPFSRTPQAPVPHVIVLAVCEFVPVVSAAPWVRAGKWRSQKPDPSLVRWAVCVCVCRVCMFECVWVCAYCLWVHCSAVCLHGREWSDLSLGCPCDSIAFVHAHTWSENTVIAGWVKTELVLCKCGLNHYEWLYARLCRIEYHTHTCSVVNSERSVMLGHSIQVRRIHILCIVSQNSFHRFSSIHWKSVYHSFYHLCYFGHRI